MQFSQSRRKNEEERILPLINIVFLLLIFFMLAGRLAASDPFEVTPARSASEGQAAVPEVLVLVGAGGELALDGVIMDEASLGAAVAERLTAADTRVRLKADGGAMTDEVVAVMELLRDAGVKKLNLLTVPLQR